MIKLVSNSENSFGNYWNFDDYQSMSDWILTSSILNGRYLVIDSERSRIDFLDIFEEVVPAHIKFDDFSFEDMDPDTSDRVFGAVIINGKCDLRVGFWTKEQIIDFVSCLKDGVECKFHFKRSDKVHTAHYIAETKRRAFKFLHEGVSLVE